MLALLCLVDRAIHGAKNDLGAFLAKDAKLAGPIALVVPIPDNGEEVPVLPDILLAQLAQLAQPFHDPLLSVHAT
jgi:hypothetical protein